MYTNSEYSLGPTSTTVNLLEIGSPRGEQKDEGEFQYDIRLSEMRLKHLYGDSVCKGKLHDVWVCWV